MVSQRGVSGRLAMSRCTSTRVKSSLCAAGTHARTGGCRCRCGGAGWAAVGKGLRFVRARAGARDDSRGLAGSRVGPERRCDVEAGSHRVVPDVARGRQRFAELARRVERSSGRIECERKRAVVDRRAAVADPASKGAI
eukprot:2929520-Prymnesium_polylepis.1